MLDSPNSLHLLHTLVTHCVTAQIGHMHNTCISHNVKHRCKCHSGGYCDAFPADVGLNLNDKF